LHKVSCRPLQGRGRKPVERGRSGAVRPVKSGPSGTPAVKIKSRYAQVSSHFYAQKRTSPASLPSWPCRFDPGHPLHRKTLTQQGFSRAHGLRVLLKRRSCVPSGAVRTTPVPRRHDRDHPGKLAMPVRSRAPAPPKTLTQQGFSPAHGLRVLPKRRLLVPRGAVCTTPPRQAPARQAGHAGSVPGQPPYRFWVRHPGGPPP